MAGAQRLPEVAGLRRVGFLHLLQQQQPGLVLRLDLPLATLGRLERLDGVPEPLASDGTTDLLERTVRPLDFVHDPLEVGLRPRLRGPRLRHVRVSDDALRYRDSGTAFGRFAQAVLCAGEILSVALPPQFLEPTDLRRMLGDCLDRRLLRSVHGRTRSLFRRLGVTDGCRDPRRLRGDGALERRDFVANLLLLLKRRSRATLGLWPAPRSGRRGTPPIAVSRATTAASSVAFEVRLRSSASECSVPAWPARRSRGIEVRGQLLSPLSQRAGRVGAEARQIGGERLDRRLAERLREPSSPVPRPARRTSAAPASDATCTRNDSNSLRLASMRASRARALLHHGAEVIEILDVRGRKMRQRPRAPIAARATRIVCCASGRPPRIWTVAMSRSMSTSASASISCGSLTRLTSVVAPSLCTRISSARLGVTVTTSPTFSAPRAAGQLVGQPAHGRQRGESRDGDRRAATDNCLELTSLRLQPRSKQHLLLDVGLCGRHRLVGCPGFHRPLEDVQLAELLRPHACSFGSRLGK